MISWTLLYITLHIFEYIFKLWFRLKAQLEMHKRNAHIRSVNFCVTMIVFNQELPRQVILRNSEFYESKMYLVWKLWLLSCSYITPTQFFRIFLISSLFHNFIFIYIWWIADISPLSQCCSNDSQKGKWKNEHRRNREKKGIEPWYFNFKPRNQILNFVSDLLHSQFLRPSKILLLNLKH